MANRPTKEQAERIDELQAERDRLQGEIRSVRYEGGDDAAKKEAKAVERVLEINDELTQFGGVTNEPGDRKGENTHVSEQRVAGDEEARPTSASTSSSSSRSNK